MSLDVKWIGAACYTEGRQGNKVSAIVPHIIEGSLDSCDNTFISGARQGSAHYGVGGKRIHQYVAEADTAWAVGNWQGNLKTISIEHEGTTFSAPTYETIDTGARLMAEIASRLGWTELTLGKNVMLHKWYSDTSCPASLDYVTEIRLANGYLRGMVKRPVDVPHGIYRLYDPNSGQHFFTISARERDVLISAGWSYEGVGWREPDFGDPVYRAYNPNSGEHLFTMSREEIDGLVKAGWNDEGTAFSSDRERGFQIFRFYNGYDHMYTQSNSERKTLLNSGIWKYEGVAFYGAVR